MAGSKRASMPFLLAVLLSCFLCMAAVMHIIRALYPRPAASSGYSTLMESGESLAARAFTERAGGGNRDSGGPLVLLEQAILRDPASPYRWADYGEELLHVGDRSRARRAMLRAAELGPHVGPVLLRLLLFSYRTGDRESALTFGRRTLEAVPEYDSVVFMTYRNMGLKAADILQAGIPDGRSGRSFLRSLMARDDAPDAEVVWAWSLAGGFADDRLADDYATFLLRAREPKKAAEAWSAYAGAREPGYPQENAVFNGSFERASAGRALDWRIDEVPGVKAERDSATAADGRWSLRLSFDGAENVDFGHVAQRAYVSPGEYRFEGRVRTDRITTDQGIGFLLFDIDSPDRLHVATERLTGTHDWTTLAATFTVPHGTRTVDIRVVRSVSLRFDNRISGDVWVDGIVLRRKR